MVEESNFESALEPLRAGLGPDGFDLRVGGIVEDDVRIVLEAKPGACLECLVPDDLMVTMLEDAIRRVYPSLGKVELVKEGFGVVAH
jgi:hypothetical protein